jgi:hypothetical protein
MQNYWTENGWELLKIVAKNAALKSGFPSTVVKVVKDALELTLRISKFPHSGKHIKNVYGEDRYWSVFNEGKVAIWKIENDAPVFVGAYSSLPDFITA